MCASVGSVMNFRPDSLVSDLSWNPARLSAPPSPSEVERDASRRRQASSKASMKAPIVSRLAWKTAGKAFPARYSSIESLLSKSQQGFSLVRETSGIYLESLIAWTSVESMLVSVLKLYTLNGLYLYAIPSVSRIANPSILFLDIRWLREVFFTSLVYRRQGVAVSQIELEESIGTRCPKEFSCCRRVSLNNVAVPDGR